MYAAQGRSRRPWRASYAFTTYFRGLRWGRGRRAPPALICGMWRLRPLRAFGAVVGSLHQEGADEQRQPPPIRCSGRVRRYSSRIFWNRTAQCGVATRQGTIGRSRPNCEGSWRRCELWGLSLQRHARVRLSLQSLQSLQSYYYYYYCDPHPLRRLVRTAGGYWSARVWAALPLALIPVLVTPPGVAWWSALAEGDLEHSNNKAAVEVEAVRRRGKSM